MLFHIKRYRYLIFALSFGLAVGFIVSPAFAQPSVWPTPRFNVAVIPNTASDPTVMSDKQTLINSLISTTANTNLSQASLINNLRELTASQGEVSLPVAAAHNNLAWFYHHQNQFADAELHYWQAIRKASGCKGDNEVTVAIMQQNLADMYVQQKNPLAAMGLYRKSLLTLERRLGATNALTRGVHAKYAPLRVKFLGSRP